MQCCCKGFNSPTLPQWLGHGWVLEEVLTYCRPLPAFKPQEEQARFSSTFGWGRGKPTLYTQMTICFRVQHSRLVKIWFYLWGFMTWDTQRINQDLMGDGRMLPGRGDVDAPALRLPKGPCAPGPSSPCKGISKKPQQDVKGCDTVKTLAF